jgi:hypothetical protein
LYILLFIIISIILGFWLLDRKLFPCKQGPYAFWKVGRVKQFGATDGFQVSCNQFHGMGTTESSVNQMDAFRISFGPLIEAQFPLDMAHKE